MTIFAFDPPTDEPEQPIPAASKAIHDTLLALRRSHFEAKEQLRRREEARNRVITFRVPVELLARLDAVAVDAACTRGHLIRQIIAEYMWYVEECNVRYRGSLLTAHSTKRKELED